MASGGRKLDLYFAVNFEDLRKKAAEGRMHLDKANAQVSLKLADKLWNQSEKSLSEGDEELAYYNLYRCVNAITPAKTKRDYPRYKGLYRHLLSQEVLEKKLGILRNKLEQRYSARAEGREMVDEFPDVAVAPAPTPTTCTFAESVKPKPSRFALKICELKIGKLPLNLSRFDHGGASDPQQTMKVTVLDVDPQPVDESEGTAKFCKSIKQTTMSEDGGGSALSFWFKVESFDEQSKLVGMAIRVEGPFVVKLLKGCDSDEKQTLKMNLTMKLYGENKDLYFQDAQMKVIGNESGGNPCFGIDVGLYARDEWMDDTCQPKAKIILQLIGDVEVESASAVGSRRFP